MHDLAKALVDDEGGIHACPLELFDPKNNFLSWWDKHRQIFKQFRVPLCHKGAEQLIRDTLQIAPKKPVTDSLVRRAIVVAALSPLRQNIGSCFATAPAILIHDQQPENLIADLLELLSTGRLKRTYGGVEYAVPLCINFSRSPTDCPLLKAWEYTLAAFSEVKMEFSRWNLYLSLGLHPEEKSGIGEVLYHAIDAKLAQANHKMQEYQVDYERAIDQLRAVEALLRQAGSEGEMHRLKAECQSRYFHMQSCQDLRDKFHDQAKQFSLFFSFLIQQYDSKFQEYFQEIYDPKMAESSKELYEDYPAGFRLFYKHGRADPTLWTPIDGPESYIRFLADFFTMTEAQIGDNCETEAEKKAFSEVTTAIIQHLRTPEFLQSSVARSAKHGREPWAYISGGTMETLVKTYYCKETLEQESRWVENDLDLSIFILETLKALPVPTVMLMQSPSHAFILHPEWEPFCEGWKDSGFTYTWLRDNFVHPMQEFYSHQLSRDEQTALMQRLSLLFETSSFMTVQEFRRLLHHKDADSFLFQSLPLTENAKCQAVLQELLEPWISSPKLPQNLPSYLTAHELRSIAEAQLDPKLHLPLAHRARQIGLAPQVLRFADTNWVDSDFAFVLNPGTLALELWRINFTGTIGSPMTSWKHYFGDRKALWSIYTNPIEYQTIVR